MINAGQDQGVLGESWHGRGDHVLGLGVPTGASQKWRLRVR